MFGGRCAIPCTPCKHFVQAGVSGPVRTVNEVHREYQRPADASLDGTEIEKEKYIGIKNCQNTLGFPIKIASKEKLKIL